MIPTMVMYMLLKIGLVTIVGMIFVPPKIIQRFFRKIGRIFNF